MKCPNCGKEIQDGSKFCSLCGTKIEVKFEKVAPQQEILKDVEASTQNESIQPEAPKKKGNGKLIFGVVVALCAAIGIGYGVANYKPTIKLANYTTVEVTGYDGIGTASISIDWDAIEAKYGNSVKYSSDAKSELGALGLSESALSTLGGDTISVLEMSVDASADKTTELSNNDTITVKYKKNSSIGRYITCNVDTSDLKYTVSGLEEVETFDAFENLKIEYSGVSGDGSLSYNYEGDEDLDFSSDNSSYLSNGDEVTISININDVGTFAKKYGHIPEKMSKTYTVEGLSEYCNSIAEIPQAAKDEMRAQADDELSSMIASARKYNYANYDISDATYVGDYLCAIKTSAKDFFTSDYNLYGMVYKMTYNGKDRYIGVVFNNISANDAGEYEVDLEYPRVNGSINSITIENSLDEYKNDFVDTKADSFTIEWGIQ